MDAESTKKGTGQRCSTQGLRGDGLVKCNRLGCPKEATHHEKVPIGDGSMVADTHFCDEHYEEGIASLKGA
jgi:hypothetical protein